jgi:hypothetical protein
MTADVAEHLLLQPAEAARSMEVVLCACVDAGVCGCVHCGLKAAVLLTTCKAIALAWMLYGAAVWYVNGGDIAPHAREACKGNGANR